MVPGNKLVSARNTQPSCSAETAENMAGAETPKQALSKPIYDIEYIRKISRNAL